ncbi:NAD(P)/FAD-dependent oxidoreductase [Thiohalorhabdus sp. Cl-TMA]|uniref:NAD(P)/FAD-dependent oxidoreductase n=1 Tax=Thiohalorhabdus methylotrophus TaxID=3242694 RepID=A0ABV4TYX8_9GAMM
MSHYDVIIIGAGAAGLMCAATAGQRGRRVLVVDHANKVGKKILMSGGGRCNFTNLHTGPEHFRSANPHFMKSALARYTQWDFIALVERHGIPYHEKKDGQLFCDRKARDIVGLLLAECREGGVEVRTKCPVTNLEVDAPHRITTGLGPFTCDALVIATGGLSIPRMGATGFGLELAERLGLRVLPTRAALVPFTLPDKLLGKLADLAGISVAVEARCGGASFREAALFTHRGLSGPAMLQASTYWEPGEAVTLDLLPGLDLRETVEAARRNHPHLHLKNLLGDFLPKRVAQRWCAHWVPDKPLARLSESDLEKAEERLHRWTFKPSGTEGYATAEVTLRGVDTAELSSKTLETKRHPGLYFIGEVVDVTGHLGGHNFQWAWASGHAAGTAV